jgi:hypothetical protein
LHAESGAPVEKLLFSAEVVKINRKEKHQRRALILTDVALYNFSFSFFGSVFSNLKRRIAHTDLGGIVLSRTSDECVVRVINDYDYRYIIERRSEVVEVLSKCYQALSGGKPLAVAFSQETDLGCETKTKDSMSSAAAASASGAAALADAVDAVEIEEEPPCSEGFRHRGVIREGWLAKKKGLHEKWELKYFVLTCDRLSYHSVQVQGVYDIDSEKVFAHSVSDDIKAPSNAAASHSSETSSDCSNSNSSSTTRSASSSGEAGSGASGAFASTKSAESRRASVRRMSTIGGSSADLFDHYLTLVLVDRSTIDLAADSALDLANWTHELKNKGALQGWLMMKLGRASKAWRRVFLYLRGSRMWFYAMEPKVCESARGSE